MEEKHVHWKRPAVDKIFKYEQTPPSSAQNGQSKPVEKTEAHVHWKEPAVESVHEYDKKLPPSLGVGRKDPVQGRYLYPEEPTVIGPSPEAAAKGTRPPDFSDCLRSDLETGGPSNSRAGYGKGTTSFRNFGG